MATRYLYLRTNLALVHSQNAVSALRALSDYGPEILGLGRVGLHWEDGFVIRFGSSQTPKAISSWLGPKLSNYEAWACHDGINRCAEYPAGAQTSTFFEGLGSKSVSQLLVRYDKNNQRLSAVTEKLRGILDRAGAKIRPVVDFRDGRIFLIAANEPQKVTYNRCQACLRDKIPYAFIDAPGDCFTAGGKIEDDDAWTRLAYGDGRRRAGE